MKDVKPRLIDKLKFKTQNRFTDKLKNLIETKTESQNIEPFLNKTCM